MSDTITMRAVSSDRAEIMLYGDLGAMFEDGVTAQDFVERLRAMGRPKTIGVRINSDGGEVSHALAIYNALTRHPARIEVDVDGIAASSASLVMMAGDVIRAAANAIVMIHEPWSRSSGTASELRARADQLELIGKTVRKVYAGRTRLPESRIGELMAAETWMEAPQALALGFIDELTASRRIAAHVDRERYKHTPADLLPPAKTPHRLAVYRQKLKLLNS